MTATWALLLILGAVMAALIYPGELSHVSSRLHRSLYDRAARNYDRKWHGQAYHQAFINDAIVDFSIAACHRSGVTRVIDLGCGTGRGIRLISKAMSPAVQFIGVDSSAAMLDEFEYWLQSQGDALEARVSLTNSDLGTWAQDDDNFATFGLVMMFEVGEFLPQFKEVMHRISDITAAGGGLILTRPAGLWRFFFPGRMQSREALSNLLASGGFEAPTFVKWRSRYELVFCKKKPG